MGSGRSLWFVAPGQVEIRSTTLPPLEDGQLLLRTMYSGISTGTELLAYRGELDPDLPVDETIGALGGTFRYPFRYGYSCVGVVEETRATLRRGDVVFVFHPHDDRFVADATERDPARLGGRPRGDPVPATSRPPCRSPSTPARCSTTRSWCSGSGSSAR